LGSCKCKHGCIFTSWSLVNSFTSCFDVFPVLLLFCVCPPCSELPFLSWAKSGLLFIKNKNKNWFLYRTVKHITTYLLLLVAIFILFYFSFYFVLSQQVLITKGMTQWKKMLFLASPGNLHHQKPWSLNKLRLPTIFIMSMEEGKVIVLEKSAWINAQKNMEKLLRGNLCARRREFRVHTTKILKLKSFVQKQDIGYGCEARMVIYT